MTEQAAARGREAFGRHAWREAFEGLSAADGVAPLGPEDLELLGTAAYLAGLDEAWLAAMERAHQAYGDRGDAPGAARCSFWLALPLLLRGEGARGGGWLSRAQRLLDAHADDCVERGFLLVPAGVMLLGNDVEKAFALFDECCRTAARFGDAGLASLGRLGQGQAMLRMGKVPEGLSLFDEAMVAVTAGEVSAIVSGIVYCAVISDCHRVFDLRRAQEWTAALDGWCKGQPDLVPFRGQCLIHRAEMLQLRGEWPEAMAAAEQARDLLSRSQDHAAGAAFYQWGEILRLRGRFAEAEEAYRQASRHGRQPEPGLPLVRMALGHVTEARAGVERALNEAHSPPERATLLGAHVEIALAARDVAAARGSAEELSSIANEFGAPLLQAESQQALGAVALAEGDPRSGLRSLREAWKTWTALDAPYEAARVRVLIAEACRQLKDEDGAELELDAARTVFEHLGAPVDLGRTGADPSHGAAIDGLTDRQLEVLRLIASGHSNRDIASALVISEYTVARHVQNILSRLGVASRTAAAAFAFEHDLI